MSKDEIIDTSLEAVATDIYQLADQSHIGQTESITGMRKQNGEFIFEMDQHINSSGLPDQNPVGRIVYTITISARWDPLGIED